MRHLRFLLVGVLSLFSLGAGPSETVLSSYRVVPSSDQVMQQVADKFEVTHREGAAFEVIVPANRVKELLKLVPNAVLLEKDIKDYFRRLDKADELAGYHSFSEVQAIMKDYATRYPDLVTLTQYGTSRKGNPLVAMKLSDRAQEDENEPEILLTAATHGDEIITTEVVLGIMDKLITGYAQDTKLRDLVDNHEIYFIPVVNADGFISRDRYDNGADPNRSYPWPENPSNKPTPSISPLIEFFAGRQFVASIDFHASGELIMYPWAYTYSTTPDEQEFSAITHKMAEFNGYSAGQISKIIYIAKGSSADYYYWKTKSLSLGIEMALTKAPSTSLIPSILKDNWESTLHFIEEAGKRAR